MAIAITVAAFRRGEVWAWSTALSPSPLLSLPRDQLDGIARLEFHCPDRLEPKTAAWLAGRQMSLRERTSFPLRSNLFLVTLRSRFRATMTRALEPFSARYTKLKTALALS